MKIMINRHTITNMLLVFVFCVLVVAYMNEKFNVGLLKTIGLVLLDAIIIREYFCLKNGRISKLDLITAYMIFISFTSLSLFNITETSYFLISIFYNLNLAIWISFSYAILYQRIERFKYIFIGLLLGIIVVCMFSSSYISPQINNIVYNDGRLRIYGAFTHPNISGSIAMSTIMCWCIYYLLCKNSRIKFQNLCVVAIPSIVLVLSQSRTSISSTLLFLLGILYIVKIRHIKSEKNRFIITFFLLLFAGAIAFLLLQEILTSDNFITRINSIYLIEDYVTNIWIGNGNVGNSVNAYFYGSEFSYTLIILKFGIIGVCIYLLIFTYLIFQSKKVISYRQKKLWTFLFVVFLLNCCGEAFLTNITNVASIFYWISLSSLNHRLI